MDIGDWIGICLFFLCVLAAAGLGWWYFHQTNSSPEETTTAITTTMPPTMFAPTDAPTTAAPFTTAPPATAAPVPTLNNQQLQWSNMTGYTRFLDCDKGACTDPANRVQIWNNSGAAGQHWTWKNGGMYSGGEVLATKNNGLDNNTPVVATTDSGAGGTGGQEFRWQLAPGGWQLLNPWSNKCLDVAGGVDADGSIVQLYDCNISTSRWMPV